MSDALEVRLRENAAGPKRARGDSGEVEQHALPDQVVVDRYLASKQAAKAKGLGVRVGQLVPPGAV